MNKDAWREKALCRGMSVDVFVKPESKGPATIRRYAKALSVCAECPVIKECLEYALEWEIPHGVFGGKLPKERRNMILRRQKN